MEPLASLAACFEACMGVDHATMAAAAQALQEGSTRPGFAPLVMQFLMSGGISEPQSQIAALCLKNLVRKQHDLCIEDQQAIQQALFDCIRAASTRARPTLTDVVDKVVAKDIFRDDEAMETLRNRIISTLNGEDGDESLSVGLIFTKSIAKAHQYVATSEWDLRVRPLCQRALPPLLGIVARGLEEPDLAKLIDAKDAMRSAVAFQPAILDYLSEWMDTVVRILDFDLPDGDEASIQAVSKLQKWALRLIRRVTQTLPGRDKAQFDAFTAQYSLRALELVCNTLICRDAAAETDPKVTAEMLVYLSSLVDKASTWKPLKAKMENLVPTLLDLLSSSDDDHELWEDDPVAYIRRVTEIFGNSPRAAASCFISDVLSTRRQWGPMTEYVSSVLEELKAAGAEANAAKKEGALRVVTLIAGYVGPSDENVHGHDWLGLTLDRYVLPELQSPHGFLRACACDVVRAMARIPQQNEARISGTLQGLTICLEDSELPVRYSAAVALGPLAVNHEMVIDAIKPHVVNLVGVFLQILAEVKIDEVTCALNQVVELFPDELSPRSTELLKYLVNQFGDLAEGAYEDDDEVHEAMAALGTLETIRAVVLANEDDIELRAEHEEVLLPTIAVVLEQPVYDFLDEILQLMHDLTDTRPVSPGMWQLLHLIDKRFPGEFVEYFEEFVPVLYNYARYGLADGEQDGVDPAFAKTLLDIVLAVVETNDDLDRFPVPRLLECLISWDSRMSPDDVARIAEVATSVVLKRHHQDEVSNRYTIVVLAAVRRNLDACLQGGGGNFYAVIQKWLDAPTPFSYSDRKLGVLALSSLVRGMPFEPMRELWPRVFSKVEMLLDEFEDCERRWNEAQQEAEWSDLDEDDGDDWDGGLNDDDDDDVGYDMRQMQSMVKMLHTDGDLSESPDDSFRVLSTAWDLDEISCRHEFTNSLQAARVDNPEVASAILHGIHQQQIDAILALPSE